MKWYSLIAVSVALVISPTWAKTEAECWAEYQNALLACDNTHANALLTCDTTRTNVLLTCDTERIEIATVKPRTITQCFKRRPIGRYATLTAKPHTKMR